MSGMCHGSNIVFLLKFEVRRSPLPPWPPSRQRKDTPIDALLPLIEVFACLDPVRWRKYSATSANSPALRCWPTPRLIAAIGVLLPTATFVEPAGYARATASIPPCKPPAVAEMGTPALTPSAGVFYAPP